jgi:hypothetical protein
MQEIDELLARDVSNTGGISLAGGQTRHPNIRQDPTAL